MVCSNCGTENPPGRKFCGACGQPLAVICPVCGTQNEARFAFCGECGSSLAGVGAGVKTAVPPGGGIRPSAPVAAVGIAAAPVSERRLVSVLFADLVGFTSLSETRDPDEVRDLLSRYFDTARQIVLRYGGMVEKFIGDAVMAVWGTPVAQEDDAERAVRAALDLVQAVGNLGEELETPDLKARAGVLTGEAAVTLGAEGQGMVAGDLVNTASRIQALAEPGTVLVGEATRRATEAAVVYEQAAEHEVKGKAEPVSVSRAVRVIGGRGGALRSEGLEAPFVGRDHELRQVKDLFFASAEERKAHLLQVIGIAGIGKSRLAWEFYKYFDGLVETYLWHRGRCLAYGEGVTYWALAEMVRGRAGITEGEDPSTALEKLKATAADYLPDAEERAWVEPRLAHLLGLEERTATEPEDLFSAWRLFFERVADRFPVIMVFEDMQWADRSLVDFVDYLQNWSRGHPIFVMALARPEVSERYPQWVVPRRGTTALHLEPLSEEDMRRLLDGLVPGLPEQVERQILDRAEGVPLYAMETVRMLLDRGLLAQEGAVYRPTGPVETLEIPETLHALIAARLDGLDPKERAVLQDAAVLGKTFTKGSLSALSALAPADVEPILTGLVRKEVLFVQADPRSPERGQYGFLQDLVRRVAYETLSKKERKARHLVAASNLESGWGGEEVEIVEILASHYVDAYQAAPDALDAEEIKAKAREALTRAGQRSQSLAANEEAQRYFERAEELADDPQERGWLGALAGETAWAGGRSDQGIAHLEAAAVALEAEGLIRPAARVNAKLAPLLWYAGQIDRALDLMERAFTVLSEEEPDENLAEVAAELARLYYFKGERTKAWGPIEVALTTAEALGLTEVLSQALNTKHLLFKSQGRPRESEALLKYALEIALANDLPMAAFRALNNLVSLAGGEDRFEQAMPYAQSHLELSDKLGLRTMQWTSYSNLAWLNLQVGEWDVALQQVAQIPPPDEAPGSAWSFAGATTVAVVVHGHRGEEAEAARLISLVQELIGSSADVSSRAVYEGARAEFLSARGDYRGALAAGEAGVSAVESVGFEDVAPYFYVAVESALRVGDVAKARELMRIVESLPPGRVGPIAAAQAARFRALIAVAEGRTDEVEPEFEVAETRMREVSNPFRLAVILLEHGEWLLEQNRADEVERLLAEATRIFEGLRARPWVERTNKVLGALATPAADAARA